MRYAAPLLWIKVAHWDRRSYAAFCDLDGEVQSYLVAAYLTDMQGQAVETKEANRDK